MARTIRAAVLAVALGMAVSGCSLLPGGKSGEANSQATANDASDAPPEPAFDITVLSDSDALRELIQKHNDLQRYQTITDLDEAEFSRLMVLAERDTRDLLATAGYLDPVVQVRRQDAPDAQPVLVIGIEPGPATTVTDVKIGFEGDIASSGDASAVAQRELIREHWDLPEGSHFTQADWSGAKTEALRRLVEQRYPRGRISYSLADLDIADHAAKLTLRLDSGPLYRLGPARVRGARRYPANLPERLSWLKPGDLYDQKKLVEAQQRLAGSGYYDSAFIGINADGDPDAVPVNYVVREAKRHKVQLGVGYSTDGGPRLTLEHRDNTVFGTSWRAETKLHFDQKAPLLQTELSSLPDANGWRWAGLGRYMRQDDGILNTLSKTLRLGRAKNTERYDRSFFLQYDHATVTGSGDAPVPDALLGDGAALSANYNWTGRYFNSLSNPTRGYGLGLELGAGLTLQGSQKPFARINGRWLGFVPIGKGDSRLALRSELGAILANSRARLPSTYMFRTGGDTTVRGYAFRRIAIPVGYDLLGPGRYMGVASAEWQRPILQDKLPGLLEHTVFVDVGSIANRVGDLNAHWGVGTGIRVLTPVGPMQLDIAYGLKPRRLRLHMNVGFVF